MPEPKFLKCACAHCGGRIEFPADGIGATIPCPHCGHETDLTLETPTSSVGETSISRKWIIAGIIILVVGVVGVFGALFTANVLMKKARERAVATRERSAKPPGNGTVQTPATTGAKVINDFAVSNVRMEKKPGSTLAYATGSVRNSSDKQRFGVTVEIDLLDDNGTKVGAARDYKDLIEPRTEWTFRALVVAKNASAATVSAVHEK